MEQPTVDPTDPQGPIDPKRLAAIQANVATMRSKGASDDEVRIYLHHEDGTPDDGGSNPGVIPGPSGIEVVRSGMCS